MKKEDIMKKLKGQLIVSCQALPGEPLYMEDMTIMPLMAKAAMMAGAKGIRANSVRDIREIKKAVDLPVIGIIKNQYEGGDQYITVSMKEVDELVEAGADIVALDCTLRPRYDGKTINQFIREIKDKYPNQLLMADISNLEEAKNAAESGVDFVGTTLNGYTPYTANDKGPNIELMKKIVEEVPVPLIAEGRIHTPEQAREVLECGAFALVVGGAITRPMEITDRFLKGMGLK